MSVYEEGFYKKENIVGYTGDLWRNPTVYFRKGNKFGRITQFHNKKDNIGRNYVRNEPDYDLYNRDGRAREFYRGQEKHKSRNEFIEANIYYRMVLGRAIVKFQEIKPRHKRYL